MQLELFDGEDIDRKCDICKKTFHRKGKDWPFCDECMQVDVSVVKDGSARAVLRPLSQALYDTSVTPSESEIQWSVYQDSTAGTAWVTSTSISSASSGSTTSTVI